MQDLPSCTTEIQHECLQKISVDTYNCKKSCNGLLITSFSKTEFDKNLERHIPKALNAYRKYKKMFQYNPIMEGMKHLINIVIISTFPLFYMQNMCGKTSWDMWGSTLTPQHLTESPRIEQQSLLTCCQLLEAQWDFSQGSLLSVLWRSYIFL